MRIAMGMDGAATAPTPIPTHSYSHSRTPPSQDLHRHRGCSLSRRSRSPARREHGRDRHSDRSPPHTHGSHGSGSSHHHEHASERKRQDDKKERDWADAPSFKKGRQEGPELRVKAQEKTMVDAPPSAPTVVASNEGKMGGPPRTQDSSTAETLDDRRDTTSPLPNFADYSSSASYNSMPTSVCNSTAEVAMQPAFPQMLEVPGNSQDQPTTHLSHPCLHPLHLIGVRSK